MVTCCVGCRLLETDVDLSELLVHDLCQVGYRGCEGLDLSSEFGESTTGSLVELLVRVQHWLEYRLRYCFVDWYERGLGSWYTRGIDVSAYTGMHVGIGLRWRLRY